MIKLIRIRRICVVTGTRAEYGLLKPIMMAIHEKKELELHIIVAGMHLSKEFGYSFKEIIKDWKVVSSTVPMDSQDDGGAGMALSISKGIKGMIKSFKEIKPTFVVILGDRTEAFAAAIAAAYMNIPIAHIHGGDKTRAGLDESVRHAITKLAYIHFAATKKSAERIIKMGEDKWRVFVVGAPGIDAIKQQQLYSLSTFYNKFGIKFNYDQLSYEKYLVLIQHPVTTQPGQAKKQITETIKAITDLKIKTFIIYPNSDAGSRIIIQEINKLKGNIYFKIFKNLDTKDFLSLLAYSSVLVGNSSCGIIEAPYFGIPVVNIGIRQDGRERANNVIDAQPNRSGIKKAIKKALSMGVHLNVQHPYGKGNTGKKIVDILSKIPIRQDLIQKTITY